MQQKSVHEIVYTVFFFLNKNIIYVPEDYYKKKTRKKNRYDD
jgi:hypothetical protein